MGGPACQGGSRFEFWKTIKLDNEDFNYQYKDIPWKRVTLGDTTSDWKELAQVSY